MSGKRLLVNADGYGFTRGLNRGIEEVLENGVVRSISVNANFDAAWDLKDLVARHPDVSVGVHLNPVVGRPIADPADVPTLVDTEGYFHWDDFTPRLQRGAIDLAELAREMGLQIERIQGMVQTVTHLDGHQDRHVWPKFFGVFLDLADRYGIERMRTHARLVGMEYERRRTWAARYYATNPRRAAVQLFGRYLMGKARRRGLRMCDRRLTIDATSEHVRSRMLETWIQVARACPSGTNEIVCHPGYVDDDLRRWAKKTLEQREDERRALGDPRLRAAMEENGIRLITFHDI
ncbi:MAG: ChbG/HpnK family deacetylase [Actinobacteria bacterium]|nr:ChbG/HpnK family deacetylase [Actinomycetota bacterium]